jgi:hypothetical protein
MMNQMPYAVVVLYFMKMHIDLFIIFILRILDF